METMAHSGHIRMRRLRRGELLRDLLAHSLLTPARFVLPMFVRRGENIRQPILSMPGQFQLSPDQALEDLSELAGAGLKAFLLFGVVDAADKDDSGSYAHNPDNAVCTTLRLVRDARLDILAITDLCYCEYTSHGHCGVLTPRGPAPDKPHAPTRRQHRTKSPAPADAALQRNDLTVDNDATVERLGQQAVLHAQAGADILAPSGMMDHATAAIRRALDDAGFQDRAILSYAVKYASGFYGPFRDAAESPPRFGDRRGYQMDFRRSAKEAMREALLDVQEGADMVMVKPALAYLDVLSRVAEAVPVPCAVYQVSGEYAMLKAAADAGWIEEKPCVLETMHAFFRAGAAFVITYYAAQIAQWLREG